VSDEDRAALRAELDRLRAAQLAQFTTGQLTGVRDEQGRSATFAAVNGTALQARIDYLEALLSCSGGSRRRPILIRY
jgi:hypothetical protein